MFRRVALKKKKFPESETHSLPVSSDFDATHAHTIEKVSLHWNLPHNKSLTNVSIFISVFFFHRFFSLSFCVPLSLCSAAFIYTPHCLIQMHRKCNKIRCCCSILYECVRAAALQTKSPIEKCVNKSINKLKRSLVSNAHWWEWGHQCEPFPFRWTIEHCKCVCVVKPKNLRRNWWVRARCVDIHKTMPAAKTHNSQSNTKKSHCFRRSLGEKTIFFTNI